MGHGGKLGHESLQRLEVRRHAFENEINLPGKHPALPYQWFLADELFECLQVGFRLAGQVDHGKNRHLESETFFIEQGAIALDVAGEFECAHAPEAWRWGDTDPLRKLDIGHTAIVLQFLEDLLIDCVESQPHCGLLEHVGLCLFPTPSRDMAKQSCGI